MNNMSGFGQSIDYRIFIMLGLAFIGILCIFGLAIWLYRFKKGEKKVILTQTLSSTTMATDSSMIETSSSTNQTTDSTLTTSSFTDNTQTLLATQNVYSIPGHLQIIPEDIRIIKMIAKGGQGTISEAEILNPNFKDKYKTTKVIVKSLEMNFDQLNERQKNNFNQELSIIYYFKDQPGFVRVFGYNLEQASIILKYYPLGSFDNLVLRKNYFKNFISNKYFILVFLLEFSRTIKLLHEAGFVHCDIKPQNILIEKDPSGWLHPILTDFGITQIISDRVLKVRAMTVENIKGFSLYYAAPEQIQQMRSKELKPMAAEIVKRRDIFAIGGLIYGLMMKKEPWH